MDYLQNLINQTKVINPDPQVTYIDAQGKQGPVSTPVIHFDFSQQLLSIIKNQELMDATNLVVNPQDPFGISV